MDKPNPANIPAIRIGIALATLALAVRLSGAVRAGRIDASIYRYPIRIDTGSTGVGLPSYEEGTLGDLTAGIDNLVLLAVSGSALTTDEVLLETFGGFNPNTNSDQNLLGIREMVYQTRNAFAHSPFRPQWLIRASHRKKFAVVLDDGLTLQFDAQELDGKYLKPEDIGGFEGWIRLLYHCQRMVAGRA